MSVRCDVVTLRSTEGQSVSVWCDVEILRSLLMQINQVTFSLCLQVSFLCHVDVFCLSLYDCYLMNFCISYFCLGHKYVFSTRSAEIRCQSIFGFNNVVIYQPVFTFI